MAKQSHDIGVQKRELTLRARFAGDPRHPWPLSRKRRVAKRALERGAYDETTALDIDQEAGLFRFSVVKERMRGEDN